MRKVFIASVLAMLLVTSHGYAQQLSLPSIDGITVFYRAGKMSRSSMLRAAPTAPCTDSLSGLPMCGWGFETVYQMTKEKNGPQWGAELAVGYDFLTLRATTGNGAYQVLGSIQTLPSITLYVSRDLTNRSSFYAGLGTSLVVLKNVRAYDSTGRIYSIAGDTWGLTPCAGVTWKFREIDDRGPGARVFVELAFEVRDFPSITYTLPADVKTLPPDLPRSLAAKGPVLNFGFEVNFRKKDTPKP
jgi:hypothetical protein